MPSAISADRSSSVRMRWAVTAVAYQFRHETTVAARYDSDVTVNCGGRPGARGPLRRRVLLVLPEGGARGMGILDMASGGCATDERICQWMFRLRGRGRAVTCCTSRGCPRGSV